MKTPRIANQTFLVVQLLVIVAVVGSYAAGSAVTRHQLLTEVGGTRLAPVAEVPRETPLVIEPLYDDPEVVSDEELAAVLSKLQPNFPREKLKPNYVEHALRTWWLKARFADPKVMSGDAMKEFLTDHSLYLASWGEKIPPLLLDEANSVAIRWGKEEGVGGRGAQLLGQKAPNRNVSRTLGAGSDGLQMARKG